MGRGDLVIGVDGNVTGYERAIDRAQSATRRWEAQLTQLDADLRKLEKQLDDDLAASLKRQHDAMDKTGKAAFLFGAAVGAGLALAANEAIKWESAWAGVQKTVNGNAEEMAHLEDQLRGLTQILPASHQEIAAVAEAAGQLGIQRQNLAEFTKVMVDLGQTTNLSADQAATAIAQLMNVMQTAPDKVDEIGNTLADLGNKGASTESQILDMAQRLAGAGKLVGASESDVLGLASAMANLGIESELGGGAIQRVFLKIYDAVKEGGDKLDAWARLAGTSADEFAQAWASDPISAFDLVIKGMGRVQAQGGNLVQVLNGLKVSSTQNNQVLLRLAGAGDMLTESLSTASAAWENNNALVIEAAKRYETTEAKIALARNQLRDASIDIGNTLLPAIAHLVSAGSDLIRFWSDLPGPIKTAATVLAILTTATALFGGAALIAIPKIAAFRVAVESLEAGALKTAGTRLMGLGALLTGPWGIAIAAGVTALGIFAAKQGEAAKAADAFKDTLDAQTGSITQNSRAWALQQLGSGNLGALKDAGVDIEAMTTALVNGGEAWKSFRENMGLAGNDKGILFRNDAEDAAAKVDSIANTIASGKAAWQLYSEATGDAADNTTAAGDAASSATTSAQGLTGALKDGATAAGNAADSVKTLGEELDDFSSAFLDKRSAGRAIRGELRDIDKAIADYKKNHKGGLAGAFTPGSESGDQFGEMLDQLAGDYQKVLEAKEKSGASETQLQGIYDRSRAKLVEVATQILGTKKAAEDYADAVLGTPESVHTHFVADGLDQALTDVQRLDQLIRHVPKQWKTEFRVNYTNAQALQAQGGRDGDPNTPYWDGGYTGFGPKRGKAGDVHYDEFVVKSESRRAIEATYPGLLASMNATGRIDSWAAAGDRVRIGGGSASVVAVQGGPAIDYDRLAAAMSKVAPLYGDVHVTDGYGGFLRQMEQDRQMAGIGGLG
jgi:TP901 family phage tail tape measure protein